MNRPLSVLIVEDEPSECKAFIQHIEETDDIRLIGVTNSSDKALELTTDCLPDAIILDLELHKGSGNGISFLLALDKERLSFSPYILVTTNNVSLVTHEQVRLLGADFIMLKSQADYSAKIVIDFLLSLKGVIHDSRNKKSAYDVSLKEPPNEVRHRLSIKVSSAIDLVGISPKAIGRRYLIDAILLIIDGQLQNHVPTLAQRYGKTDASVERAMQNAINSAWRNNDIEELQRYYTACISSEKGVPTLTEFIFYFANKIKI